LIVLKINNDLEVQKFKGENYKTEHKMSDIEHPLTLTDANPLNINLLFCGTVVETKRVFLACLALKQYHS